MSRVIITDDSRSSMIRFLGGTVRLAWFIVQAAWWLVVLAVTSVALAVRGNRLPHQIQDAGEFVRDGDVLCWRDLAADSVYLADENNVIGCEVAAFETGLDMRMTAVSRLSGNPAVASHRFAAVIDGTGQVAASAAFAQQRYARASLDHVDPAQADSEAVDLRFNREQAIDALARLDRILAARGWSLDLADRGAHWYSRRYRRPAIRWNSPLGRQAPVAAPPLTDGGVTTAHAPRRLPRAERATPGRRDH